MEYCRENKCSAEDIAKAVSMLDKDAIVGKIDKLKERLNKETLRAHDVCHRDFDSLFDGPLHVDVGSATVFDDEYLASYADLPEEAIKHFRAIHNIPEPFIRSQNNAYEMQKIAEHFAVKCKEKATVLRTETEANGRLRDLIFKANDKVCETKAELDNLREKLMETEEKLKECRKCNAFLEHDRDCYQRQVFDMDTRLNTWLMFGLPAAFCIGAVIVAIIRHFLG